MQFLFTICSFNFISNMTKMGSEIQLLDITCTKQIEQSEELVKRWNIKMPIEYKQKHQKLNYRALIVLHGVAVQVVY